jgi:hypothetical protein
LFEEGEGRCASRVERRRAVRRCGNEEGEEGRGDHSAMQRLVLGCRWGVRAVMREGRTEGVAK